MDNWNHLVDLQTIVYSYAHDTRVCKFSADLLYEQNPLFVPVMAVTSDKHEDISEPILQAR